MDKVKGFSAGWDDYIVKPFSLAELEARVSAHLRRQARHSMVVAEHIRRVRTKNAAWKHCPLYYGIYTGARLLSGITANLCILAAALLFYRNKLEKPLSQVRRHRRRLRKITWISGCSMKQRMSWEGCAALLRSCALPLPQISLKCGGRSRTAGS